MIPIPPTVLRLVEEQPVPRRVYDSAQAVTRTSRLRLPFRLPRLAAARDHADDLPVCNGLARTN